MSNIKNKISKSRFLALSILATLTAINVSAAPPTELEISGWVQRDQLERLAGAMDRYKNERTEAVEQLDKMAQSHQKLPKTPEEKAKSVSDSLKRLLNRSDSFGFTPLHWASIQHNIKRSSGKQFIKYLLEMGSDPMMRFPNLSEHQIQNLNATLRSLGSE